MARVERTSKKVAHIAGLILGASQFSGGLCVYNGKKWHVITVENILAMAGSLTTQAADKPMADGRNPKRKRARRK